MDASPELVKAVSDILSKYGDQIVTQIREQLQAKNHIATGNLYNSVQFQVVVDGNIVELQVLANDYFKWVDQGRGPNKKPPPLQAIIDWIAVKGIKHRSSLGSAKGLPLLQRKLAYAIQNSIGRKGFPRLGAVDNTLSKITPTLVPEIGLVVAKATTYSLGNDLAAIAQETGDKIITVTVN